MKEMQEMKKMAEMVLPQVVSDYEYDAMSDADKGWYTRPHFVYAHGRLEDDMKIDLVMVKLNGKALEDGLEAEYKGAKVVFHLYESQMKSGKTGIVTYIDDKEAFDYGRELVRTKPEYF